MLLSLLLQVAIALSLLVADVTAPPFNETVCTFSAQPQLHAIQEGSLMAKVPSHLGACNSDTLPLFEPCHPSPT